MKKKIGASKETLPAVKMKSKSSKQRKSKTGKLSKKTAQVLLKGDTSHVKKRKGDMSVSKLGSGIDALFRKLHHETAPPPSVEIPSTAEPSPASAADAIPLKKARVARAAFALNPATSGRAEQQPCRLNTDGPRDTGVSTASSKKKRRKQKLLKRRQKFRAENGSGETGEDKLESARFRYLNEQLYTCSGHEALKLFSRDQDAFAAYHQGFRNQVAKWPVNPLDLIIKNVNGMPPSHLVVDLGCGEARLAASVRQRVLSYDLVASNERVTACDMARLPLPDGAADAAVLCLALMGTNLADFVAETNRVLRVGGQLRIAEVASRFDDVDGFVSAMKEYGFSFISQDLSHRYFYLFSMKKTRSLDQKQRKQLPPIELKPCLYKRR